MLHRHGTRLDIGTADDVAELNLAEARRRTEGISGGSTAIRSAGNAVALFSPSHAPHGGVGDSGRRGGNPPASAPETAVERYLGSGAHGPAITDTTPSEGRRGVGGGRPGGYDFSPSPSAYPSPQAIRPALSPSPSSRTASTAGAEGVPMTMMMGGAGGSLPSGFVHSSSSVSSSFLGGRSIGSSPAMPVGPGLAMWQPRPGAPMPMPSSTSPDHQYQYMSTRGEGEGLAMGLRAASTASPLYRDTHTQQQRHAESFRGRASGTDGRDRGNPYGEMTVVDEDNEAEIRWSSRASVWLPPP